jgi:thiamine biosynthesis protein ThiS
MQVTINGQNKEVSSEMNLIQLLKNLELPTERIAIELNKDVIRKKDWEQIKVSDQDKIEIIHFVGGG